MELSNYEVDPKLVEEGMWVKDIPNHGDIEIKCRGLTSAYVTAIRTNKERKCGPEDREKDGSLKPQVVFRIFCEVLHEAVLLDWNNFRDKGTPLTYEADFAKVLCTDPRFRPFANLVTIAADIVDRGRVAREEGLSGNWRALLSGNSDTGQQLPN